MTVNELIQVLEAFKASGYSGDHEVVVASGTKGYQSVAACDSDMVTDVGSDQTRRIVVIYIAE